MARGRHPTRLHIAPPTQEVAEKYLRSWYGGDIIREPHKFPGLTSQELFGNNNPLEIDFGCGMGVLTCDRARQNSGSNIIGIDFSQKPIFCGIHEAHKSGLDNIKFVRCNFNAIMPLLKPSSITKAYYLFPNPSRDYFNKRANEGRMRFLAAIYNALADQGQFIFATDSSELFKCMETIIKSELQYSNVSVDLDASGICTWYRNIWESRGKDIFGITFSKTGNAPGA
ncbi:MAG: methyltransferase domain-containing protein [Fibrobacter sp.]|nr:methyltransferase domain-containing protein [Fibrobacter sp.]